MSNATYTVMVEAISRQGEGNLALQLVAVPPERLLPFEAGAHIDVHLPGGLVRQYSLANAPGESDHYLICVRQAEPSRGGSRFLHHDVRVGDRLQVSAPRNCFELQAAERYLLMAAGIGITPLLSMAEQLERAGQPFELHYFVRAHEQAAFARRFARGFTHGVCCCHASSDGESPRQWLPEALKNPTSGARLYLCGPEGFMQYVGEQAKVSGWAPAQVHQEAFAPRQAIPLSPADEHDAHVEVTLARSGLTVTVPPDHAMAAALQAAGVDVPLSCEMGICGACLTRVIEGEVAHCDSVQSDEEKAADVQYIALCCSRSRSARMVIDL